MDTYQNSGDASFRGGYAVAQLDPAVFVLAMAEVSKKGFDWHYGSTSCVTVPYATILPCRFYPTPFFLFCIM
jgi:hypothetical protein